MSFFSRSTFLLLIFLLHSQTLPKTTFSKTLFFHFPPFSNKNLLLLGNSSLLNNSLYLTKTAGNLPSSTFGATIFLHPISITPLLSFSTTFSILLTNPNQDLNNTITFFLLPNISTHYSPQTLKHNSLFSLQFPNFTLITATINIQHKKSGIFTSVTVTNPRIIIKAQTLNFIPNPIYAGFFSTNNHVIQSWTLSSQTPRRITLQSTTKSPNHHFHTLLRATILASSLFVIVIAGFNLRKHLPPNPLKRRKEKQLLQKNIRRFEYSEIASATDNFADLIGRGGSARVYKMNFPPSSPFFFAVKRFTKHEESKQSYLTEFETITRIQHDNILTLRGWCDDSSGENMLVYDYMPQNSLHHVLHSQQNPAFSWPQRLATATKLADAINHLHHECCPPVVHGDVKCRNVLMTSEWEPKLGDFGMSRVGFRARKSGFDEKGDVGSYGEVVIEMCTGRTATDMAEGFVEVLREMEGEGRLIEAADKRLENCFEEEEMLRLLRLGLVCACVDRERRPKMEWVLRVLNGEVEVGDGLMVESREGKGKGKGKGKMMLW